MKKSSNKIQDNPQAIEKYINSFEGVVKDKLIEMRSLIKSLAPDAVETISYAMPTFKLNGRNLVHFAGYKGHIGFYPGGIVNTFKDDVEKFGYKHAKGSVQFPLDQPLPVEFITKVVKVRIQQEK